MSGMGRKSEQAISDSLIRLEVADFPLALIQRQNFVKCFTDISNSYRQPA